MAEARYPIAEDNTAIFQDFMGEAPQLLEIMESALLSLARNASSTESVDAVMRSLHTLKGIFGFLGLDGMHTLCHDTEDALSPYRSGGSPLPQDRLLGALAALDAIRRQVKEIGLGLAQGSFLLVELGATEAPQAEAAPADAGQEGFLRIRVEKMDFLLELIGEMAICQDQVSEGLKGLELPASAASELNRLGKISRELQQRALSLRLVPIEPLFLRAGRVAYDASVKTGKSLEFISSGQDTELDKRMVEALGEPLLHLIRNAVDHGLESAETRLAAGKKAQGRVSLSASREAGGFLLELEDDGKGLNLAKLAAKGRAMGLISAGEEHDEARVTSLIFEPGFSTAEAVTGLSGRGVGLDAVRRAIEALKGEIHVESRPGLGCRFSIRLPLNMALVDGILVLAGGERYIVPASQIQRFAALKDCAPHGLQGRGWLESAGKSLPLVDLAAHFGTQKGSGLVAVHVLSLGREAAIVVDEVLGKQQVVAKRLSGSLAALQGVSGGAILGDGKVSLILDLEALLGRERASLKAA